MGKVIVFEIEKGGSAKTTTAINTAAILAGHGKKILFIDSDSQSNGTKRAGLLPQDYYGYSIFDVLTNEKSIKDCIVKSKYGFDVVPSNKELQDIVVLLLMNTDKYKNPMYILQKAVNEIKDQYDFILIDTPPTISFNTITTLLSADAIIIPFQCEPDALDGLINILDAVKRYAPNIEIMGVLPTMFNRNTNVSTTVLSSARRLLEGRVRVYDTTIYKTVKFPEADLYRIPAIFYSDNEIIQNYREFVREAFDIG